VSDLNNKRILVTGGDSTARVIAEHFLAQGAKVVACDVRPEAVEDLGKSHANISAVVANVGDEQDVARLYDEALSHMGGVDVLVNVVGIAGPTKPTEEVTAEEWRQSLDINLTGMFFTARAVIPGMKQQRSGAIINFSTGSTQTLLPNRSPYVVSKYGVEGLTLNLARELGPYNIRANGIRPGGIDNDRLKMVVQRRADAEGVSMEHLMEQSLKYVSMRTLIQPSELADMVVFLASDKARHVTGQIIAVDGNSEWEE